MLPRAGRFVHGMEHSSPLGDVPCTTALTFGRAVAIVRGMLELDPAESPTMRRASPWRTWGTLAIAGLVLAAFYLWSYGDCIGTFFHFDDFWVLSAAAHIQTQSPWDVVQFFRPVHGFVLYRPVSTLLYFSLLHQLFGYDPTGYHATQIAFHIGNALLVYAIADSLFLSRARALATALVYATAPGHAIAACWMALFTMTGTAFFYFLGLWVWLQIDSRWRVPLTLFLFCVSLLASEHAVSFPIVLTLAAVLLGPRCDWRRVVREQVVFYLIAAAAVAAKVYALRYNLAGAFPDPAAQMYVSAGYAITLNPLALLRHLGRYFGFSVDLAYRVAEQDVGSLAVGAAVLAAAAIATVCVLTGRWTTRPLRIAAFGLDVFIVTLGQVLVLQAHLYSYYIGIAALGMSLALVAFASALPRWSVIAPATVVAALVTAHVLWTVTLVRHSDEFIFLNDFSRSATRWLYSVASLTEMQPVDEVVVPRNKLTALVFDVGEAHRLLLCARYRVRTAAQIDAEREEPGRLLLRRPIPFAQVPRSWAWMHEACARQHPR